MTREYDATSPIDKRNAQAKSRADVRDAEFTTLMGNRAFRRFIWDLMAEGGAFLENMATDPHLIGVNEGKRQMALYVLAKVNRLTPERYAPMMAEANDLDQKDEDNG